jgi:hypothetical protein
VSEQHRAPENWRPPAPWLRVVLALILSGLAVAFVLVLWACLTLHSRGQVVTPSGTAVPTWVAGS